MIERITILGGSSVYIPEFILSVISRNLNVKEIVLHGQPGRKLDLVADFSRRLLRKSGFPAEVNASTNIREAVDSAEYVLNHIRVGGMQARMRDEMLPPKFDMIGDENIGAGGIANALRTLPIVLEYASEIEAANPNCTFINLTNPMGIIVEGLIKYSSLNVVGVCDRAGMYARKVANILQQDLNTLQVDYIGINHLGWIQDVRIDNRSYMSQLLELLEGLDEDGFDANLIELFRMIPTRGTGAFFNRGELLKKQKSCGRFRAEILHEAEQRILKLYEDEHLSEIPDLTRQRNALWYEETILPLIEAFEKTRDVPIILCVKNNDSIRDLPADCSVEIPTLVSKKGVKSRKVGSLPKFLRGVFLASQESDRLTVEAVKHRSYESALQALTINPFVPSYDTARKYLDRIIRDEKLDLH